MTNKTYQTTLLIRGDSKNAVRSVQLTRDEIEKLTGAQKRGATATQQFASAFSKANGAVDKTSRAFQGLGGLIAGLGIGTFFKAVVDNTIRQEKAVKQLETVLTSTGGAAGRTSEQMQAYAASLQAATTFGDEAIIEAQAMLATFTDIQGVNFDKTTDMILDLSTAMGQDLKTSTIQLGKALNDPIANLGALSRTGIQFSEAQKDLIKSLAETGQKAEAQTVILQELERQFGGSAAAAKDTLGGALTSLGNTWNDLLEVQEGAVGPMKDSIRELESLLSDPQFKQSIQDLASGMINLGTQAAAGFAQAVESARFFGEELARIRFGIAADDIAALEGDIAKIEEILSGGSVSSFGERFRFFGPDGVFEYLDDDELRGKLDELKAALTEARKAQDDFAASSVKSKEAATDNSSAVAKEAESVTKYTKAVIDADKHIKEFNSRHEKANKEFEQGHKILDDMVEKSEDYVRQLEFEVSLIGKTEREQAILTAERKLGAGATQELKDRTREYTGELFDNKEAMKAAAAETKRVGEAAKEMEQVWADSRSVLSDFFFEFAADGKDAFDTLVEGFKAMIAKMIAEAAANQIILGIGAVAGGLGFSGAANAASLAGGGGVGDLGNLASSAYGIFSQGSSLFTNQGLQFASPGDGGAALGPSFNWANAGLGLAGGLAGGFAANQVFGRTSGIGSTLGGLAGTLIPGVGPLLGAGIGSFLGGGLESILGGKNNGDNKGRADIDLSTGAFNTYGVGKSFNQANVDEAGRVSQQLKALSDALGGSDAALKIAVGNKSGYSLNGEKFGKDVDAFFSAATKSIIEGAKQLDPVIKSLALAFQGTAEETAVYAQSLGSVYEAIKVNAVDRAAADIEAVAKASNSLYDAYFDQVDIITDLVRTFDGSATAAANLNASLLAGKEAAYALAAGIASIGGQVSKTLLDSADQIRNSVLTQEEREAALRYKGKFLEAILPAVTNPDDILTIANELEKIITTLYNAYENPTTADAELAASALERIEATTRVQLEKSLENVRQAEEATNQRTAALFDEAARQNQEAARQQLESANIQRENMANFGYYVERLTRSNTQGNARPILAGGEVA